MNSKVRDRSLTKIFDGRKSHGKKTKRSLGPRQNDKSSVDLASDEAV